MVTVDDADVNRGGSSNHLPCLGEPSVGSFEGCLSPVCSFEVNTISGNPTCV